MKPFPMLFLDSILLSCFWVLGEATELNCRDENGYEDENSLANKIGAWRSTFSCFVKVDISGLKIENAITRPDGLGTGNVHRGGNTSQRTILDNRSQLPSYCVSKLISQFSH